MIIEITKEQAETLKQAARLAEKHYYELALENATAPEQIHRYFVEQHGNAVDLLVMVAERVIKNE